MAEAPNNFNDEPFVFLIEHDPELRNIMEISLAQEGVKVAAASKFKSAWQFLKRETPDVFIVDYDLHDGDPGRLINIFRENPNIDDGLVMVTISNRLEDHWRRDYQPDSVIYKPFDIRYLIRIVKKLTAEKGKALI